MGFLDHSTNNVIVDAVLTDKGREALANGTFSVESFSLADDEVDYSIIRKFGRTVGKEKIIKNTPIFEAQTVGTLAMKHRLFTAADPTIINLPTIAVAPSTTILLSSATRAAVQVTVTQTVTSTDPTTIPNDTQYTVEVPSRYVRLYRSAAGSDEISASTVESSTQTAVYLVSSDSGSAATVLSQVTIYLAARSLTQSDFNAFGTTAAKNTIDCVVTVMGNSSGLRTTIPVQITKE
jgi:hypothetical protein